MKPPPADSTSPSKTVGADVRVLDRPIRDTTQGTGLVGKFISDIVLQILSFVAENELGEGLCKLIIDRKDNTVAGAHLLGNPCSEIIQSLCIAIEHKLTVEQLEKVVFPHPTVGEIVKETLFSL